MEKIWSSVCQMSNKGPTEKSLSQKDETTNANADVQWSWKKRGLRGHIQAQVNFLVDNKQLDGSCVIAETSYIFWCKPRKVSGINLRKVKKLSLRLCVELAIHNKTYVIVCRGWSVCENQDHWNDIYCRKAFRFLI